MTVAAAITVALRAATNEDLPFLREVYGSGRADELSVLPWSDEDKAAFIDHQFAAQVKSYQLAHPSARFLVILGDDVPVGRVFLADIGDELRVLDIGLLAEHRGLGIGTVVMSHVLEEARTRGMKASLHVEEWNPARRLYERLGFAVVGGGGPSHLRMEAVVS